jgi:hypothetical protein
MPHDLLTWPVIRVVPFSEVECPRAPTSGPELFTWRDFYTFRNAILRVLSKFGTTGPMGEMPILDNWELSKDAWKFGMRNPDFFVVSDMWNAWNRWSRVESSPQLINPELLTELVATLMDWPGWCVYLALKKGGLTVFADRILYEGPFFEGSVSIADLANRCASDEKS